MYVHPDAKINGFKLVKIPSNVELMRQFGLKLENPHDGSNGKELLSPDNPNGLDNLDRLQNDVVHLDSDAAAYYRALNDPSNESDKDSSASAASLPASEEA